MLVSARYSYVYKKVTEFIKENAIVNFPIDIKKIANSKGWVAYSYNDAEFLGMPEEYCYKKFGKNGGTSPYYGDNIIFYNDNLTENVKGRIRFTITHEIGHIYLNHFKDFDCANISKKEYKVLEKEANCFARNVLSPIVLVISLNLSKLNIIDTFGITDAAAVVRVERKCSDMYWSIRNGDYELLLKHFEPFIYKATHSYHCSNCQTVFVAENANYCPICRNKPEKMRLHIRSDFDMIYPGLVVDKNSKLKQCPCCGNEEIDDKAEYCKICCKPVINKCTNFNCGELAVGNARYCIFCGAKTTFYEYGLLKDWQEVISEENVAATNLFDDKPDVPF